MPSPALLSLDIGTTMGFAVAREVLISEMRPLDATSYSCWPEKLLSRRKGERPSARPKRLRDALVSLIASLRAGEFFAGPCDVTIIYEDIGFQKGHQAAMVFGELRGVIFEVCETFTVTHEAVHPSTYRQYLFGHTGPKEDEVAYLVASLMGEHWQGETDHNALDAMALLIWKLATSTNEKTGEVPGLFAPARWCPSSATRSALRKQVQAARQGR